MKNWEVKLSINPVLCRIKLRGLSGLKFSESRQGPIIIVRRVHSMSVDSMNDYDL